MAIHKSAVVIDTQLNTNKITGDFKDLEKKTQAAINQYNRMVDSIKSQSIQLEKAKAKQQDLNNEAQKYQEQLENEKNTMNSIADEQNKLAEKIRSKESILANTEFGNKASDIIAKNSLIQQIEDLNIKLKENDNLYGSQLRKISSIEQKISSTKDKELLNSQSIELLNSKIEQTKDQANQAKKRISEMLNPQKFNLKDIIEENGKKIDKFGNKISRLIKTVFIFNLLRSALSSLRTGFMNLLKSDEQFSNSLNQIKANLMTAFTPIYNAVLPAINALMSALSKLTGTIAMFISGLFGKSIQDTTKDAKKLSKSLNGVASSGSKATGSLAGFDKLEVIQESGGGGGGGASGQSLDFSGEMQYSKGLLDLLNQIKDFVVANKELVIGFVVGLATTIGLIKLGLGGIMSIGIGIAIWGVVTAIQNLIKFINDPSFESFIGILEGIALAVLGVAIAVGAWPVAVGAALAFIIVEIVKNYDKVLGLFDKFINWINTTFRSFMNKYFGQIGDFIVEVFMGRVEAIKSLFQGLFGGIKKIVDGIVKLFKGDFKGGMIEVFGGLKDILLAPFNMMISAVNGLIRGLNKVRIDVPDWVPAIGGKRWGFNIPEIPKLAEGAVIPPRHEFAAILGDQKHGTNIETPLETMKQAFRDVLNESNGLSSAEKEIILRDWTIICQMGSKTAQKFVINSIREEEKATGTTLLLS